MPAERPILFSAPMVKAILDGRKTQTRRVVKLPTWVVRDDEGSGDAMRCLSRQNPAVGLDSRLGPCDGVKHRWTGPYGRPGDRLWVRETWAKCTAVSPATDAPMVLCAGDRLIEKPTQHIGSDGGKHWNYDGLVVCYRATSNVEFCDGDGFTGDSANREDMQKWRPSIHMPRWACRLLLDVTAVRVERLQAISEEDAFAEGIGTESNEYLIAERYAAGGSPIRGRTPAVSAYAVLWDDINGDRPGCSWADNPWVWVVTFRRVEG